MYRDRFNTGSLATARGEHTASVLADGKVLVAGGSGAAGFLSSAELYSSLLDDGDACTDGNECTSNNCVDGAIPEYKHGGAQMEMAAECEGVVEYVSARRPSSTRSERHRACGARDAVEGMRRPEPRATHVSPA